MIQSTSTRLHGEMMASSIKKLSECPVCFVEMVPPMKIFQCINGHSLCENCRDNENVTTCPSCRVSLKSHIMSRSILAENLIEAAMNKEQDEDGTNENYFIPSVNIGILLNSKHQPNLKSKEKMTPIKSPAQYPSVIKQPASGPPYPRTAELLCTFSPCFCYRSIYLRVDMISGRIYKVPPFLSPDRER